MNPKSDYGLRQVRIPAGNIVQWSVPEGCYVVIQPRSDNVNNITISTQDPTGVPVGTVAAWTLLPGIPATGTLSELKLPAGYGGPVYFSGTPGEHVIIWILPGAY